MSNKYLLREYYELCPGGVCQDILTEDEKIQAKNGTVFLSGIMQRCDEQNGNGRVYPGKILRREVKNYMKVVTENRACGELDHPEDSVVNLKNASHTVTSLWWEGQDLKGKIRVLTTPAGNILKALINDGISIGISSRGLGSVTEQQGKTLVEDDFQLICFDIVSEPSTQGAYMMTNEGKQKQIWTKGDRINRLLKRYCWRKMKKSELKQVLKPLIKECIKEVIFEDGTLSGIITEVAKGLAGVNVSKPQQITEKKVIKSSDQPQAVLQARKDLEQTKEKLQSSTGLKGIFEGTTPIRSKSGNSQHSSLRDMDPSDPGVDITGIMKIAGGAWNQLK